MAGKTKSQKKKALDMRSKMYLVLALCSVMLLVSVGISLVLIGGIDLGGADAQSVSTVDSASMVVESGYNKEENTIDTQAYTSTILEQAADAGDSYVDETLFLGDSNTARMYRMFDYCSYDNAIGSVGMTAKSLATFACVQVSTSSGYITMPQAVAKLQPRRVILTFGTNDLNPGYKAADFVKNYQTGIEAIVTAYPSVDIIVNAIPPIGQQHSNQSLTQTQVDEYNKALVEMCQEKDWKFLNSAEVLKDSVTGYAKSGYVETSDGIHLTRTAMDALFNYIRTHSYITEDDRPALTTIPKHTGDKDAVVYTVPVYVKPTGWGGEVWPVLNVKVRERSGEDCQEGNDLLRQVLPQDLNAFGMIPEFVGRTPVVTQTQALDEDDLVSILTEPKNAVVRQYRKMFQLEDVDLEFEDAALHEIARMALARKTGARGLRAICEDVLQQTMFDLPSEEGVAKVIVTEAAVKGEEQPQRIYG